MKRMQSCRPSGGAKICRTFEQLLPVIVRLEMFTVTQLVTQTGITRRRIYEPLDFLEGIGAITRKDCPTLHLRWLGWAGVATSMRTPCVYEPMYQPYELNFSAACKYVLDFLVQQGPKWKRKMTMHTLQVELGKHIPQSADRRIYDILSLLVASGLVAAQHNRDAKIAWTPERFGKQWGTTEKDEEEEESQLDYDTMLRTSGEWLKAE